MRAKRGKPRRGRETQCSTPMKRWQAPFLGKSPNAAQYCEVTGTLPAQPGPDPPT